MGQDQPDPTLILEGSQRTHPSRRIQGQDYPTTALQELEECEEELGKAHNSRAGLNKSVEDASLNTNEKGIRSADECADVSACSNKEGKVYSNTAQPEHIEPTVQHLKSIGSSQNTSDRSLGLYEKGKTHQKDPTKPVGEACNEDRTLKDASELEWPHSPTKGNGFEFPNGNTLDPEEPWDTWNLENDNVPTPSVRTNSSSRILDSNDEQSRASKRTDDSDDQQSIPQKWKNSGKLRSKAKKARLTKKTNRSHAQSDTEGVATGIALNDGESKQDASESDANRCSVVTKRSKNVPGPRVNDNTKDLRLCRKVGTGSHPSKKTLVKGWFCKFCLQAKGSKLSAFLVGNVTSHWRHLVRTHLDEYWTTCTDNGFDLTPPKDWIRPAGWAPPNERDVANTGKGGQLQQQPMSNYVQRSSKPPPIPPVTKTGIKEHLLAIVATCDLPFRFVERPTIRGFITYLNHKIRDEDIPHKTCIAAAVNKKVLMLEGIMLNIIEWELKKYLVEFNSPVGRHMGILIGKDLLVTMRKFRIETKLGWMVGVGVSANDVAVRTVCKELDPMQQRLKPKQVQILCIDHSMHRAAYHFIKALDISSLSGKRKQKQGADDEENNKEDDETDIDVSMDIEASADDVDG